SDGGPTRSRARCERGARRPKPRDTRTYVVVHRLLSAQRRSLVREEAPINTSADLTLMGVDVGATTIAGGLVTGSGEDLEVVQAPTQRDGDGTAVETLLAVVADLLRKTAQRGLKLAGVGIGVPGAVDPEKGVMARTPHHLVPELADLRLAEEIQARTGIRAFVDNDVNALALGEWTFGLARGASSLVLLAIGTNIGGGVIHGGRRVRGCRRFPGGPGHLPVQLPRPPCFCGGRGCLGMYLGGRQMAMEAGNRTKSHPGSGVLTLAGGDPRAITSSMVFETARPRHSLAPPIVSYPRQPPRPTPRG